MAAKQTDAAKQITYLAGALKAPRITEAATRMADQARDAGWSFEDYWGVTLLVDGRYQEGTTGRDVYESQEVH